MEEKWKKKKPLPPLKPRIFKGHTPRLVEVEDKKTERIRAINHLCSKPLRRTPALLCRYGRLLVYLFSYCNQANLWSKEVPNHQSRTGW